MICRAPACQKQANPAGDRKRSRTGRTTGDRFPLLRGHDDLIPKLFSTPNRNRSGTRAVSGIEIVQHRSHDSWSCPRSGADRPRDGGWAYAPVGSFGAAGVPRPW
jgi:hypothetical protein